MFNFELITLVDELGLQTASLRQHVMKGNKNDSFLTTVVPLTMNRVHIYVQVKLIS